MSLEKPAVTSRPVHDLVRDRWSPRAFADKAVSRDDLLSVLEAGRWAASCNNGQPWRWIIATREDPDAHAKAVSCFTPRNQRWVKAAPVVMFSLARKTFEANGKVNIHAWHDTGAAGAQMSLQAEALGLFVHQAGGIDSGKVREVYGVPEEFDVCAGVTLGYPGDPDSLPEELPGREREARARKPLEDLVFSGSFGETSALVKL